MCGILLKQQSKTSIIPISVFRRKTFKIVPQKLWNQNFRLSDIYSTKKTFHEQFEHFVPFLTFNAIIFINALLSTEWHFTSSPLVTY